MTEQARANPATELPSRWRRWTSLVAACAARRAAGGVTRESYPELYRELLGACRAAAATVPGAERDFYLELERLVLPWVTLDVLARTERGLLDDLLRRCRAAERRLEGHTERPRSREHLPAGAVGLVAALLLMAVAAFALDWWPPWLAGRVERQARAAWNAWRALGGRDQTLILLAVVTLFAVALLGRLARRK